MKESIISRTIISNFADGLYYDTDKKAAASFICALPAAVDTVDRAERYIRKHDAIIPGKLICVENVKRVENLVGMTLSTFMQNAKPVEERSKETRGTITKTVPGFTVDVLYMTADRTIQSFMTSIPAVKDVEKYCRANCPVPGKFVTVENVRPTETLYSMTESTFIALAKPMKNKVSLS